MKIFLFSGLNLIFLLRFPHRLKAYEDVKKKNLQKKISARNYFYPPPFAVPFSGQFWQIIFTS